MTGIEQHHGVSPLPTTPATKRARHRPPGTTPARLVTAGAVLPAVVTRRFGQGYINPCVYPASTRTPKVTPRADPHVPGQWPTATPSAGRGRICASESRPKQSPNATGTSTPPSRVPDPDPGGARQVERGARPPPPGPARVRPGTARLDGQSPARHSREHPLKVDREPSRLVAHRREPDPGARRRKTAAFEPGRSRGARMAGRSSQRAHTSQGSARLRYTPGIFQPGAGFSVSSPLSQAMDAVYVPSCLTTPSFGRGAARQAQFLDVEPGLNLQQDTVVNALLVAQPQHRGPFVREQR
jgi:hypothetical protein